MKIHLALWIPIVVWGSLAHATTYLVSSNGTGDFPTIQAAINAAASGDTVALADGVFTGDGNRDVSFLGKAVVVRSLSGDPATCTLDVLASRYHTHCAFNFANGEGPACVVQGITIQRGCAFFVATGGPPPGAQAGDGGRVAFGTGGGIMCGSNTGPTIQNCVFIGDSASYGGAIGLDQGAYPTIQDCRFTGNFAQEYGAAIGTYGGGFPTQITVARCEFDHGMCHNHGGGIALSGGLVEDCTFSDNRGQSGGAFFSCGQAPGEFLRCTFVRNRALFGGAGST